jgi:hypothetical protein
MSFLQKARTSMALGPALLFLCGASSHAQTILSANPPSLSFSYLMGGPLPQGQFVSVTSISPSSGVNVSNSVGGCTWLSVLPISLLPSGFATPLQALVTADPAGLGPGTSVCHITFSTAGGASADVTVTLSVTLAPAIAANPGMLNFTYRIGGTTPPSQPISLSSTNPSSGVFVTSSLGSGCGWLTLNPGGGSTPFTANAGIDAAGLSSGNYSCTITLSASGASSVPVQASLTAMPLTLRTE